MPKPLVLQTEHLDPAAAAWLAERCELVRCASESSEFPALLARADALVIRTYTLITPALLTGAPNLKVIGRAGVGVDNVDLPACAARNVTVCNTPDANTRAVVEYALALMLDATRPRAFVERPLDTPAWKALREELKARRQLCEMTLGIWGLGKIGSRLARAAAALDMTVIYHDLLDIPPAQRHGATPVTRDELCARADILTIHVDGRRSNRHILSTDALGRCKSDVVLLNTSRGFVLDPHALATFMLAHPAATALLDVHDPEPFGPTYPLLDIKNIHLLPHIASATTLANANMSAVVHDVWRVLQGQPPIHPALAEP
jgi:phosphoglycerate dehydrogenase-like enzyme